MYDIKEDSVYTFFQLFFHLAWVLSCKIMNRETFYKNDLTLWSINLRFPFTDPFVGLCH